MPTEEEINQFIVHFREARERRKAEADQEAERLQGEVEKLHQQLAAPSLSAAARASLDQEIAQREEQLEAAESRAADRRPMSAEEQRHFAGWYVGNWKLQRSLYGQYGGRAIYQQVGPEARDAMRDLLKKNERDGFFTIHDRALRNRFWEYYVNDHMHVFIKDPKQIFDHPWSSLQASQPAADRVGQ